MDPAVLGGFHTNRNVSGVPWPRSAFALLAIAFALTMWALLRRPPQDVPPCRVRSSGPP